jgi:hypothetical protein
MSLIPEEDLMRARVLYLRSRPKTKVEILCEVAREDPSLTIAESATGAERPTAWVRRTLKNAGIELAELLLQQAPTCGVKVPVRNRPCPASQKAEGTPPDAPVATGEQRFVYRPRSLEQWEARMKLSKVRRRGRR